jgi:hypothetical protein
MDEMNTTVEELQSTWRLLFPQVPPPDARQWALWITLHGQTIVRRSIAKVAVRYQKSADLQTGDSLCKFISSLMTKMGMKTNHP